MTKYISTNKYYNCSEEEFNKRINTLREMIEIFNNDNYLEQVKAYKLFELCKSVSSFKKKYELLFWKGANDSRLNGLREYINIFFIKLNEYKELGYEELSITIKNLGKEIEDYENAKLFVTKYIESNFYTEESFIKEQGITSLVFKDYLMLIRKTCPELYCKYLKKKEFSPYKLYKCGEDEFNKRIDLLLNVIKIYESEEISEIDKAYQMYKLCNKASEFDKKFRLVVLNGKNDPRLNGIYEYISKISIKLNEYKNLGYEIDFAEIRKLERKMEESYEKARMVIFNYIESEYFVEEQILEDIGVVSYEFEKYVELVKSVAPRLYLQYQEKHQKNVELRYNSAINSFVEIAEAIENGYFSDGTKFSLLEFWARVPFKENYKNYDLEFKKIDPDLPKFGFEFINRVFPFISTVLTQKQSSIIIKFLIDNKIKFVSNTMTNIEAKIRYGSLNKIVKRYINENNEEVLISFDFTEEDFQNIIDYMKLRRMPLVHEIFDCVLSEYVKGNITKDIINQMKNSRIRTRKY